MPYTKSDYPNSMKNLDEVVRVKAIDILNAMLKDGYDEDTAIPISIDQAKKWREKADQQEQEKLLNKDITKHKKTSDSARLQDSDVRVFYKEDKEMWTVQSVGAEQANSYHETKKQAVNRAQEIADNRDSKVIKEKKND